MSDPDGKSLLNVEVLNSGAIKPVAESVARAIDTATDGFRDALSALFGPSLRTLGATLHDRLSEYRATKALEILQRTKKKCAEHGIPLGTVHPTVLLEFLESGTKVADECLQEMWASLLARAMARGEADSSTLPYLGTLKNLTSTQAAILDLAVLFKRRHGNEPPRYDGWVALDALCEKLPGKSEKEISYAIHVLRQQGLLELTMGARAFIQRIEGGAWEAVLSPTEMGMLFIEECTLSPKV